MGEVQYVFGPVPSRRLGNSLGVSPIPNKVCNYSCIYCQLGRTNHMTNKRKEYFPLSEILDEFHHVIEEKISYDVVTVVGEGEPTLYSELGQLLKELKKITDKPVAVITNSALISDKNVREELMTADIVLPSLDAADEQTFRKVDRPHGSLCFSDITQGLEIFSHMFTGQIWLEVMLVKGVNDGNESLTKLKEILKKIRYDRLYINVPVRPPAEDNVFMPSSETIQKAADFLGGISIETLTSGGFYSDIKDDYEAILNIIRRHPMNRFEIKGFLESREVMNIPEIFQKLEENDQVEMIDYKGITTFRINNRRK